MKSKVFVSWSGGKDCCLAMHLAARSGLEVSYLATMLHEDGKLSYAHGLSPELFDMQAEALGIPIVKRSSARGEYAARYKELLGYLVDKGITGGVFGDIELQAHRDWVEERCREVGITAHLPLWQQSQDDLVQQFIGLGFQAIVVAVKAARLGAETLGRRVDASFVKEMKAQGITPCGEDGEFHTVVLGGPGFKKNIEIVNTAVTPRDGYWFLEIKNARLVEVV